MVRAEERFPPLPDGQNRRAYPARPALPAPTASPAQGVAGNAGHRGGIEGCCRKLTACFPYPSRNREGEIKMPSPNLVILYVEDPAASAAFYGALFERRPVASFPTYV